MNHARRKWKEKSFAEQSLCVSGEIFCDFLHWEESLNLASISFSFSMFALLISFSRKRSRRHLRISNFSVKKKKNKNRSTHSQDFVCTGTLSRELIWFYFILFFFSVKESLVNSKTVSKILLSARENFHEAFCYRRAFKVWISSTVERTRASVFLRNLKQCFFFEFEKEIKSEKCICFALIPFVMIEVFETEESKKR